MKKIFAVMAVLCGLTLTSCHNEPDQPKVSFGFTIDELGSDYVGITAEPSDSQAFYCFEVATVHFADSIGSNSELAAEDIRYIEGMIEYLHERGYDYDFVDFVYQGISTEEWGGLSPSTDHVAYAFCVDTATHTLIGDVYKVPFRTLDE